MQILDVAGGGGGGAGAGAAGGGAGGDDDGDKPMDPGMLVQSRSFIKAGCCFGMGLRFAGSCDAECLVSWLLWLYYVCVLYVCVCVHVCSFRNL